MDNANKPFRRRREPVFLFIIAIAFLLAGVVQFLWNAILPDLLNVGHLTYWKALGLLVLCRILFGGFRGGPPRGRPPFAGRAWREKWMNMSDEERAKFKDQWRQRCGRKD